jgi:hypothetical protein
MENIWNTYNVNYCKNDEGTKRHKYPGVAQSQLRAADQIVHSYRVYVIFQLSATSSLALVSKCLLSN